MKKTQTYSHFGLTWESAVKTYRRLCPDIEWWSRGESEYEYMAILEEELTASSTNLTAFPLPTRYMFDFVRRGLLRPLDKDLEIDFEDIFHPIALTGVRQNDRIYGMPDDLNLFGLFMHADRVPDACTGPACEWEDIISYITGLKSDEPIMTIVGGGQEVRCSFLIGLLLHLGLDPTDDIRAHLASGSGLLEIFQLAYRLVNKGIVDPLRLTRWSAQETRVRMQRNNSVAFYLGWLKKVGDVDRSVFDKILLRPQPVLKKGASPIMLVDTMSWCLPANCTAPELGIEALQNILAQESRKKMGITPNSGYPALRSYWSPRRRNCVLPLLTPFCSRMDIIRPFDISPAIRQLELSFRHAINDDLTPKEWQTELENRVHGRPEGVRSGVIRKGIEYIDAHLGEIQSIEDVAGFLNLSAGHFRRIFKEETGQTCWDFIRARKMKMAETLLADVTLSIKEIAYQLGFSSPSSFNHFFSNYCGRSPLQRRKELLN